MKKSILTETLTVRLSPEQRKTVEDAAAIQNLSLTAFGRKALLDAAHKALYGPDRIRHDSGRN